ncbi:MAG: hypothetical protein LC643_03435, partial [Bacteroidales bacterium]|nr:hypothetical protein [Bacteroidales bacterium]
MTLPVFSKDELQQATQKTELIRAAANQIIKDFAEFGLAVEFSGHTASFYEELSAQLEVHVQQLIRENYSGFMGLLYRIDIGPKEIAQYEEDMNGFPYERIITELIIHR